MENYSDPAHNLVCRLRFTCGAARCPDVQAAPGCYIDKFNRYQPVTDIAWHQRDWDEINRITWKDVFSLKEKWIYSLIIVIIIVFLFMVMIALKVILKINLYY